ncbi:hypothetical protein BS47DRAFT_1366548 [Hydnum rufescens UP504]|uniref:Uncharacterized protein n=1 Tax=Hydnum rufescens UP504 TaxID=1448309 RepID=A0A9P6DQM5_9AGAM|nr:hypothetical protein BS47DRAFT_1366548 [Hydnum rufescens UP504]
MHCNWPKIEYLGGMYLLSIYMRLVLPLIGRSFDPGKTRPQDPEELEEDHTPVAAGLRFLPLTDLHNDDPNPDGRLEINAAPHTRCGRLPPCTKIHLMRKHGAPCVIRTCMACPNPESRLHNVTTAPKPMQSTDRYSTTPAAAGCGAICRRRSCAKGPTPERNPAQRVAAKDRGQGPNSRMKPRTTHSRRRLRPSGQLPNACNGHNDGQSMAPHPLWQPVPPRKSTRTGTWMKPPAHNTDMRSCRRSCLRVQPLNQQQPTQLTDNGLPHPRSSGCVVISGHPCPQQNPTQQEHGQSPNRKYGHVQPPKISPDRVESRQNEYPHVMGTFAREWI